MKKPFPYVEVPEHLYELVGKPDWGTRMYRKYGTENEMRKWLDAVTELCKPGGTVSPGGAAGYAMVSRAGVHKRMKEGRISAFLYNLQEESKFMKGSLVLVNGRLPYCYIPISECKAWCEELERKTDQDEIAREAMGDHDWDGNFMKAPLGHKWQRKKGKE